MKQNIFYIMLVILLSVSCSTEQEKKDYSIKPVPFTQIKVKTRSGQSV